MVVATSLYRYELNHGSILCSFYRNSNVRINKLNYYFI